jgi:hypothetical protein
MLKALNIFAILILVGVSHAPTASAQVVNLAADPKPIILNDMRTKPAPATPIDAKKAELGGETWNPTWDRFIEQSIPAKMLSSAVPRDVRRFCPKFFRMSDSEKRTFWAYFFQALAGAEAGLNPTTNVRHPQMEEIDQVTGGPVHSEGLLQLTYQDEKLYGCDFDWKRDRELPSHDPAKTILQPERNLGCGIMILDNQIITLHEPIVTRKSYWSTLQPGTVSYRVFAKEMTNPPAACEKPYRPAHLKNATTASVHAKAEHAQAAQAEEANAGP